MFENVTVTYNVQCLQGKKFVLVLKHDLTDIHEAQLLLENCYKLDPNGVYQIVEHWREYMNKNNINIGDNVCVDEHIYVVVRKHSDSCFCRNIDTGHNAYIDYCDITKNLGNNTLS